MSMFSVTRLASTAITPKPTPTKDLSRIDQMLLRMFGTSGDGIHGLLLHFVTAVDGAYYFAPSEDLLEEVLEG